MSKIKPNTPVGLVAKDIYADLYQPVIIVKDGLINIPKFVDFPSASAFYRWINEVNIKFKGKIIVKHDKGHQYVAISTTCEEFLNALSTEVRKLTTTITDLGEIEDILEERKDLRPSKAEFEYLIRLGLISSKKYDEDGEDEDLPEEDDDDELEDLDKDESDEDEETDGEDSKEGGDPYKDIKTALEKLDSRFNSLDTKLDKIVDTCRELRKLIEKLD